MAPEGQPDAEAYLRLLNAHERSLAAYVHSLVSNPADADDLLQECKVLMWKQFDRFEPGTNFLAWGRKIALNQILNFHRRHQRRQTSPVDQDFIEAVAAEIDRRPDHFERRAEALRACLRKLPKAHRQVIVWRYFEGAGIPEIAAQTRRSESATHRLLSRIRQALNDCIRQTLKLSPA